MPVRESINASGQEEKLEILFHQTTQTDFTDKLLDTLSSAAADRPVHVTCDIDSFVSALLKYRIELPTVVIQVGTIEDVSKIKGLGDILDGLFLIIAVNGNDEGLLKNCRQLYPRLLTCNKKDFGVIAAVIEKRLARNDRPATRFIT
jgi:hypothetical protein